ncbi:hypothetical protein SAMN05216474_0872 [Lishizhenia tianjinensis]|uniref:Rho-binding antiterminator n=1 Tax=Lishizhenia tianjinensis TaxID=477690 RepID=A0A1I6YGL2_9FLAO|nr:hypothetical protein [Lishizhenia tianjinensis]SFT49364.1 hypothetical protein SAMN05216474_0872 [Lishizhenia tianjinensis]
MKNVSCEMYDVYERLAMHKTPLRMYLKAAAGERVIEGVLVNFRVLEGVEHGYLENGEHFPLIDILRYEELKAE